MFESCLRSCVRENGVPKGLKTHLMNHSRSKLLDSIMIDMQGTGAGLQHASALSYVRFRRQFFRSGQLPLQARTPRVKNHCFQHITSALSVQASTNVLQAHGRQATSIGQTATESANATRVLVLGGSIAGMLAAAAVAPYVDEIIVLDKDTILTEGGSPSEEVLRQV